jgi:hypothetical protein
MDAVSVRPGPPVPLRRQLRTLNDVELWQVEKPKKQGQRMPTIRYLVVRGRSEASFNRPHEAWRYFQQLTGAPNKDTEAGRRRGGALDQTE